MADRFLNHYSMLSFAEDYWRLSRDERSVVLSKLAEALPALGDSVHVYAVHPIRPETDLMVWSTVDADAADAAADFMTRHARTLSPLRAYLRFTNALWGFTRPSQYHPGKSPQLLDPFEGPRKPYLIVYPFSKTSEWYLLGPDTRQGMMNEHIKLGKEYPQITQLLLYSTGLADQEFVVVYETDDLPLFSQLVTALRSTDGRPYTLKDTPIYSGVYRPLPELLDCWR